MPSVPLWRKELKMRIVKLLIPSLFLLSGCICCFIDQPRHWVTVERDFELSLEGIEFLAIETHNGEIAATGSESATALAVHVKIKAGGQDEMDANRCLEAIELIMPVDGTAQKLGYEWIEKRERGWQICVSFDVALPPDISLSAETHNGDVEIRGHKGNLSVATHNGDIDVDARSSEIKLTTHNGDIGVDADTSEFRASTHNGSIAGRLGGEHPLTGEVSTHNGSISLSLGDMLSSRIVATTNNGRIRAAGEMNTSVRKKKVLVGTIGSGEGKLEIETYNGSISLE